MLNLYYMIIKIYNTSPKENQVWLGCYIKDNQSYSSNIEDSIGCTISKEVRLQLEKDLDCNTSDLIGKEFEVTLELKEGRTNKQGIKKPDYYVITEAKIPRAEILIPEILFETKNTTVQIERVKTVKISLNIGSEIVHGHIRSGTYLYDLEDFVCNVYSKIKGINYCQAEELGNKVESLYEEIENRFKPKMISIC